MISVASLRRVLPAVRLDVAAVAALAITIASTFVASPARADASGACCHPDGSCTFGFDFECFNAGSDYQGQNVLCASVECPQPPTTTAQPTTTTEEPPTTTTEQPTTTTEETSSTTTLPVTGACCTGDNCFDNKAEGYCTGELAGTWQGEGSSCEDPGICVNCGDGCLQFGETCDDGNTENEDGCDEKCGEEPCYKCYVSAKELRTVIAPFCFGPSSCVHDEKCGFCGDGIPGPGEVCDDGDTVSADCCDAECMPVESGTGCEDAFFCDGAESCDGSGNCVEPEVGPDCSRLDSDCAVGVCDAKANACVEDTAGKDGDPCEGAGSCTVGGSGQCEDGECVGDGTTLSPSCRWIICAGSSTGEVRVRTGDGSTMDANACGDTARWAGITTASVVAGATSGEGAYFYGPPEVTGDIVTGGSSVRASLYITIPGTDVKNVATGQTVAKVPLGEVDTTGLHDLAGTCNDDQTLLADAIPILDAMGDTGDPEAGTPSGLKIPVGGSSTIDVTGQGLSVVDVNGLKVGKNATLTLKGSASDVILLRVNGRLKLGFGSRLVLDGLVASNVAIYGNGSRCRLSPGTQGSGTVFCPEAGRFIVGAGVDWSGSFLGGAREVQVRSNAALTHVAFTGF
jgi:cysteine-rich repeat protein